MIFGKPRWKRKKKRDGIRCNMAERTENRDGSGGNRDGTRAAVITLRRGETLDCCRRSSRLSSTEVSIVVVLDDETPYGCR